MKKELSTSISQDTLAALNASFPVETSFQRAIFPRISMVAQDRREGKGKSMTVVTEAGTWLLENQTEDINPETGKQAWVKEELGKSFEGVIIFQRRQLRHFDEATNMYTSSPIYDNDTEVIPLFRDKKEVARGTAAELKALKEYMTVDAKTMKPKSKLEGNKILYILYPFDTESSVIHQCTLRGSSMYAFQAFARKTNIPTVLISFSSEAKEKGSIQWNQATFTPVRKLTEEEAVFVLSKVREIRDGIEQEKGYFNKSKSDLAADADMRALAAGK